MPLNDYPTAKPAYDFADTVTAGRTVVANGELVSVQRHPASREFPRGSVTWYWHAGMPIASYLVEDSVGNYSLTSRVVGGIRFYQAQDLSISAAQCSKNLAIMDMQPDITAFESQLRGAAEPVLYPVVRHRVSVGRRGEPAHDHRPGTGGAGVLQRAREVRLGRPDHVGRGLDDRPERAAGAFVVDAASVVPALFFEHAEADEPAELFGQV